jgi:glyoxylase-like metal-dependent hydrolase (beta-lactamase superfamily II)
MSAGVRIFLAGFLLVGPAHSAEDRFAGVEIRSEKMAGSVWALYGRGGTIGASIGEDGILLVDDSYAPLSDKIRRELARLAGANGKIRFIVNTHWHGDHTGGNADFAGTGATIFSQSNVRRRLMTEQQIFERKIDPAPAAAWPIVTFDQGLSFHFNGEEIRVRHLPRGHTDGDAVVQFIGSDVIHAGDLFWNGSFPLVDQRAGGQVAGFLDDVQQIIEMAGPETRIVAGHGPAGDRETLRAWHRRLTAAVAAIHAARQRGLGPQAMLDAGVLADFADLGQGYITPLRFVEFVLQDTPPVE